MRINAVFLDVHVAVCEICWVLIPYSNLLFDAAYYNYVYNLSLNNANALISGNMQTKELRPSPIKRYVKKLVNRIGPAL